MWDGLEEEDQGRPVLEGKEVQGKVTPYSTNMDLAMIGRTKAVLSSGMGENNQYDSVYS